MILYKYTGLEYIPSCIENGIYASKLDNINDPFEGKGIRYPEDFRVVCLTSSPFQMLMWAYYGNHRGCCIEFDVDEKLFHEVVYIKEFQDHDNMSTGEVIKSLYKKGYEWRHEKEWRMVYYEPTANTNLWKKLKREDSADIFLKAPVKRIIFGYAAEMDKDYSKMLEYLQKYNKTHNQIEVTKCKLSGNQYRLGPDKQFDIEAELRAHQRNNNIADKESAQMVGYKIGVVKEREALVFKSIIEDGQQPAFQAIEPTASVMLFFAAKGNGEIIVSSTFSGTSFQAGNNPLNIEYSRREEAKWEDAVNQLVNAGYIVVKSDKKDNKLYHVTEKGYQLNDRFKEDNQFDTRISPSQMLEELTGSQTRT